MVATSKDLDRLGLALVGFGLIFLGDLGLPLLLLSVVVVVEEEGILGRGWLQ